MFRQLGDWAVDHCKLVCAGWILLALLLACLAPNWERSSQDDDIRFLPDYCASVRGYNLLEAAFPQDVYASRLLLAIERPDRPLSQSDFTFIDHLARLLRRTSDEQPSFQIKKIVTCRDPFIGSRLLSKDGHCSLLQISLGTPYLALQTRATVAACSKIVQSELENFGQDPPRVYLTGPAAVGRDLIEASAKSLDTTTIATVLLVIFLLFIIYRSPLLALIPLFSIAMAAWVTINVLSLLTLIPGFYLVNISQIFAIVLLYGAGTDYCLFLISRYREELARGHLRAEAIQQAVAGVGGALVASAGTVICGLGLMCLAEFTKVRCSGPAIAISLVIALLASLTLTPALLRLVGSWAFWPFGSPPRGLPLPNSLFWDRLSYFVIARPALVSLLALAILIPLTVVGLYVRPTYRATAELSATSDSVRGLTIIGERFTPGELGPITVLLDSPVSWDSPSSKRAIELLTSGFQLIDNVEEVRSFTHPLGEAITPLKAPEAGNTLRGSLLSAVWRNLAGSLNDQASKAAREFYVAQRFDETGQVRHVTRLDVVFGTDPFDPLSVPTLEKLQEYLREQLPTQLGLPTGVQAEVYGITVNARDLATVTENDRQRINTLVVIAIFLILLALVRQPLLAAYLLVTVLMSYLATLGATTLFAHWIYGRPFGEIDWRVPFFLFVILVAVGEDYNILLISRALEEKNKHGGVEGMRLALASTGGTITSCGMIMAGTFATLMLAKLNTLVQAGFALAFGVFLDAFVIRPLLVPAFTVWLWRERKVTEQIRLYRPISRRAA